MTGAIPRRTNRIETENLDEPASVRLQHVPGGRRHRACTAATAGTSCSTRNSGSVRLSERHGVVAAFAKKALAEVWAQMRSFNDESRFTVHTAAEVLFVFQRR